MLFWSRDQNLDKKLTVSVLHNVPPQHNTITETIPSSSFSFSLGVVHIWKEKSLNRTLMSLLQIQWPDSWQKMGVISTLLDCLCSEGLYVVYGHSGGGGGRTRLHLDLSGFWRRKTNFVPLLPGLRRDGFQMPSPVLLHPLREPNVNSTQTEIKRYKFNSEMMNSVSYG